MNALEIANGIASDAYRAAAQEELAANQSRLAKMLAYSEQQTRLVIEYQLEQVYGPDWREFVKADMQREGYDW